MAVVLTLGGQSRIHRVRVFRDPGLLGVVKRRQLLKEEIKGEKLKK